MSEVSCPNRQRRSRSMFMVGATKPRMGSGWLNQVLGGHSVRLSVCALARPCFLGLKLKCSWRMSLFASAADAMA